MAESAFIFTPLDTLSYIKITSNNSGVIRNVSLEKSDNIKKAIAKRYFLISPLLRYKRKNMQHKTIKSVTKISWYRPRKNKWEKWLLDIAYIKVDTSDNLLFPVNDFTNRKTTIIKMVYVANEIICKIRGFKSKNQETA